MLGASPDSIGIPQLYSCNDSGHCSSFLVGGVQLSEKRRSRPVGQVVGRRRTSTALSLKGARRRRRRRRRAQARPEARRDRPEEVPGPDGDNTASAVVARRKQPARSHCPRHAPRDRTRDRPQLAPDSASDVEPTGPSRRPPSCKTMLEFALRRPCAVPARRGAREQPDSVQIPDATRSRSLRPTSEDAARGVARHGLPKEHDREHRRFNRTVHHLAKLETHIIKPD